MGSRPRLIPAFHAAALRRTGVATLSLLMFVGCSPTLQAPLKGPDGAGPDSGDYRLDHGYTLLMDLLADEARVGTSWG
jgi:hypothetical protein